MSTALVRRGKHVTSTPTEYGWAVPNWTYNEHQYAPGPMPAPAWPLSDYSVFGRSADYHYGATGGLLHEQAIPNVPNWALLTGGAVLLYTMRDGKKMPFRKNPYGVPFLLPALAIAGVGFGIKSLGSVDDMFSGMSGAGLFLGLGLGVLYALKSKESKAAYGLGGAIAGWGIGTAYEKAQQKDEEKGLLTSTWDKLI